MNSGLKGIFGGDFFKKQSILSDSDIKALQAYNAELNRTIGYRIKDGKVLPRYVSVQTAFNRTMKDASTEAQNMAASANGAAVNLEKIPKISKAGQVALRGLAIAGNIVASVLIMMAISKTIQYFSDLAHAAEEAKENAEDFSSSFKQMQESQKENTKTISELNDEYKKLSQGVNALGENVSLSTDEYSRYHEITNQVADLIPDLVQGFDAEGNAILKVKGNLADLNEEYKKKKQNDAIDSYYEKDDDGNRKINSVFDDYKYAVKDKYTSYELGGYGGDDKAPEIDISRQSAVKILNEIASGQRLVGDEGRAIFDKAGIDWKQDDITSLKKQASNLAIKLQKEIEARTSQIGQVALDYAQSSNDYWNLGDKTSYLSTILNNLTPEIINEENLDTEEGIANFINNIINAIKNNKDGINKAFSELFSIDLDTTTLSPNELRDKVNSLVQKIADIIGVKDVNSLKISLGFDVDGLVTNYNNAINSASNKLKGGDKKDLTKFFEDNSINTQEEIDKWNEIANSVDTAEQAKKKYLEWKSSSSDKKDPIKTLETKWNSVGFSDTKKNLMDLATSGELSPKVLNDTEEYKTLIDKLGISADQAYNKIQKLTLKDVNDDIDNYTSLLGKIRKGQSLSAKEAASFINKNASLAGSLVKVGNGYSFEENAIVQLLNTSIEGKNVIISSQIAATQTTIKQVNNRIKAYKTELKALIETLKRQAQAYEAVVELQSNTGIYLPADAYGDYTKNSNRKKELEDLIEKAEKSQEKNKNKLQKLQKELSNLDKTSSGNASGSNSGSSSSSSSKQQFDWIEKRLDHLANKTQKTIDKINNYVSQRTKKGLYKTLLNNIQDEIDANDKATKKYSQKANSVKLSSSLKQKLRTGAIKGNTKSLIQEYGEETAEKMEKYLNWYEKSQNAKQTAREKRQELLDKKREALDSQINYDNDKLNRLKATADKYQYNIDLAEAKGLSSSKKSYTDLIKNSKDQISNLKDQNSELKEYQKGLKKGSVEWYDIQKQIDDNNSSIQDLTKSQVEWNAEIRRIPLKVVQSMADLLESVKSSVQGLIDLRKQLNKYTNLSDVKKEISLKRQDIYYKTRDMQELTRGDLNEALTNEGLNDTQKQQYVKYLEQLAKGDITEGKFFELISKLGISKNDYNRNTLLKDTTKSILDDYSTILSDTSEIDQIAESYLDTQISKLQEQRDLLKDINDEKSKALELEKKQQALQEAKQNKTNLIYHEGFGFSYEADQSAINDAQRDLDDYNFELDQEQFDKAINILEEIRDNKSYVELRENGDTFLPNIDQWVGSIVKSLSSANISLNFSLDKDGNISTSPKLAKGTKYAKGGMSIVGENGIEMRLLNQGDAILPHDITENLWEFGLNPQQMIMDNLNIKIPDYSNLVVPKGFNTSNVVHIENVSLPNINDLSKAQELFDGLMTISSDAIQHANKR